MCFFDSTPGLTDWHGSHVSEEWNVQDTYSDLSCPCNYCRFYFFLSFSFLFPPGFFGDLLLSQASGLPGRSKSFKLVCFPSTLSIPGYHQTLFQDLLENATSQSLLTGISKGSAQHSLLILERWLFIIIIPFKNVLTDAIAWGTGFDIWQSWVHIIPFLCSINMYIIAFLQT